MIEAAVRGVGLAPAFQPIVSLHDESVVGFEALARWPGLSGLGPLEVFAHARATGDVELLDQLCIDASIESALQSAVPADIVLSVNCEPASAYRRAAGNHALSRAQERHLQVMFEITERSLLADPRALLQKVAAVRADGFLIALDDVGAHPDSSALLDVISPDVVKLDLALVQSQPNFLRAQTLSAVLAHHERTGAVILAEGIETEEHLEQAMALGADLGQGYRFGRPGGLDGQAQYSPWATWHQPPRTPPVAQSPFGLLTTANRCRTARKQTVAAFSKHIEIQAARAADPPIVLAALQRSEHLTPRTMARYRDLAQRSPLVAVFGERLSAQPAEGLRGVTLSSDDPLSSEWTVVTIGPHTSAALIAREHTGNDVGLPDADRRFEFVITYDRELVTAAARNLLQRIGPRPTP